MKIRKVDMQHAILQIKDTCKSSDIPFPFFFIVGAGISQPSVPLAREIIMSCKNLSKEKFGQKWDEVELKPQEEYSYWFEKAYPNRIERQKFLASLIENKPISGSNFRLAHILASKRLANVVITPNFDDFLSRSLNMFGIGHVIYDHPGTFEKIDADNNEIQIAQVHGTYRYYDCCNLQDEIEERAGQSTSSKALELLLLKRSPIVVGYSGWEEDIIMSSLQKRLSRPLPRNLFWFCYEENSINTLPDWLKYHQDVVFVIPEDKVRLSEDMQNGGRSLHKGYGQVSHHASGPGNYNNSTLRAEDVFQALLTTFKLPAPEILTDPINFLVNQLKSLSSSEELNNSYSIQKKITQLLKAKESYEYITGKYPDIQRLRNHVENSRFKDAVELACTMHYEFFSLEKIKEFAEVLWASVYGLKYNAVGFEFFTEVASEILTRHQLSDFEYEHIYDRSLKALSFSAIIWDKLEMYEMCTQAYDDTIKFIQNYGRNQDVDNDEIMMSMFNKAVVLGQWERYDHAIIVYDSVVKQFGNAKKPEQQDIIAKVMFNKALTLEKFGKCRGALETYDQIIERYRSQSVEILMEHTAKAMFNKAGLLLEMDKLNESNSVYDQLIAKFRHQSNDILQVEVVKSMFNKANNYSDLKLYNHAELAYDELFDNFCRSGINEIIEIVARGLNNKGLMLCEMGHYRKAIQLFDIVIRQFDERQEDIFLEQFARALFNKGYAQNQLGWYRKANNTYQELIDRFHRDEQLFLMGLVEESAEIQRELFG